MKCLTIGSRSSSADSHLYFVTVHGKEPRCMDNGEREILVSTVDDIVAMRLSVDKPGALSGEIKLARWKDAVIRTNGNNRLVMDGQIVDVPASEGGPEANSAGSGPGGKHMKFAGRLIARNTGGTLAATENALQFKKATEVLVLFKKGRK